MERELKIGDKVRITKPENWEKTCWVEGMNRFIGRVSEIESIDNIYANANLEDITYVFPLSSLTLIEEATEQVTEQVAEQVAKQIDWEQRRWELACKLFSLTSHEQAISSADNFIKQYRQTLKQLCLTK